MAARTVPERWAGFVGAAMCAGVVLAACGSDRFDAAIGGIDPPKSECGTPDDGCPCGPNGTVVPCGRIHHTDPSGYVVCEAGDRTCVGGKWGACQTAGDVKTASFTVGSGIGIEPAGLKTMSLGVPVDCTGATGLGVNLCVGGKNDGKKCGKKPPNCPGGACLQGKCQGGANNNNACNVDPDCPGGSCKIGESRCLGGSRDGEGCKLSCPGGTCNQSAGICDKGTNDDKGCNVAADCPGGTCDISEKGLCVGGVKDLKHCKDKCGVGGQCSPGKCQGGPNDKLACFTDLDCPLATCKYGNGKCVGGGNNGNDCDTDCPLGLCSAGKCNGGANNGNACYVDTECPGGTCKIGDGKCIGGTNAGGSCKSECPGGSCFMPGTTSFSNPCDPYCNQYVDTPSGETFPGGIVTPGGGLTVGVVTPVCGNSIISGGEQCDDGNVVGGDGCSTTCTIEPGYQCPTPGSPCIPSTCGNGIIEGLEQCDDGNIRPYDGCSPTCQRDFNCPVGLPCTAVCGDGIKFPSEQCDDGNLANGDGCSSTCTIEAGATCVTVTAPPVAFIDVPIIYRDFTPTHPDFEFAGAFNGIPHGQNPPCTAGVKVGIPAVNIAADNEPTFASTQSCTLGATEFNQWYRDTPGVNQTILGRYLRLRYNGTAYVFDSANDVAENSPVINCGSTGNPTARCGATYGGFWPINGLGYGNYSTYGKNFHFTSELRYPFTFKGGEVLSFSGDDDVFVYVAGKKVVDLGGYHGVSAGSTTLATTMNTVPATAPFTMTVGNTYEISVFQAERHVTGSNYKLTLQGFDRQVSQCSPPLTPVVITRDYQGVCGVGEVPKWGLFYWEGVVPPSTSVTFKAGTADTQAGLPAVDTAPGVKTIGTANATVLPPTWACDGCPAAPVTVDTHLRNDPPAPNSASQSWLRVFMKFNPTATVAPTLTGWRQVYSCVPAE